MTLRRVAKDVQFLGRTIKQNEAGFGTLTAGRRMVAGGAAATHVGAAASLIGASAVLGLGAASRSFAEFDKLSTQAATQIGSINNSVDQVVNNADRLRDAIFEQMDAFPATAEEMSNAAYDIFSSMDLNFGKGIDLLALFNEAAVAGMTDVETATNGAITVLNNFDQSLQHPRETLNDMFSIIRFGRIDLETLNTMMNQIAPAAAAADQSLTDVGGAIAVLTRRLGPGIASAGLARLFEIFQRRDFQEGMRKAGLAITDASGKLRPLPEILERIIALGPKPGKSLQNLIQTITAFGAGQGKGVQATVQARRALVELVKNYKDYIDVQDRTIRNNNQFDKQSKAMQQSLGVRWEKFTNRLRRNMLQIGENAIPVFEEMGKTIGPVISAWENLDASTKATIISIVGFGAAFTLAGGLVLGFIGILTSLVGLITMTAGAIISRLVPTITVGLIPALVRMSATARLAMATLASSFAIGGGVMASIATARIALASIAASLAAIGPQVAIVVGLTMAMYGNGWQSLIGTILLGAGAGFAVAGVPGAIAGATIAIVVKMVMDRDKDVTDLTETELKTWIKAGRENGSAYAMEQVKSYEAELKRRRRARTTTLPLGSIAEIAAQAGKAKIPRIGEDVVRGITDNIKRTNAAIKQQMFEGAKTIEDVNKIVEKQLKGSNKTIEEVMEERAEILRDSAKRHADLMRDLGKDQADAMEQALEDQQNAVTQAASQLVNTWNSLQQANETAMGELFKGPFLTGETFNLAEEWGVTAGIQDINRDLREQIAAFNKWQGSLRAIGARGVPPELLKSLEALGPDAVDKLETLRKASPKMFAQFVSLWRKRQDAIKRETQIDFDDQLEQWNKYGKGIAFEIIAGLRSEDVMLQKGFEKYVTTNFGGSLAAIVDTAMAEFSERKKEAIAEFNREREEELTEFYREHPELRKAKQTAAEIKKAGAAKRNEIVGRKGDTFNTTIYQQPGETDAAFAKRIAWENQRRKAKGKPKVEAQRRTTPAKRPETVRGGN